MPLNRKSVEVKLGQGSEIPSQATSVTRLGSNDAAGRFGGERQHLRHIMSDAYASMSVSVIVSECEWWPHLNSLSPSTIRL